MRHLFLPFMLILALLSGRQMAMGAAPPRVLAGSHNSSCKPDAGKTRKSSVPCHSGHIPSLRTPTGIAVGRSGNVWVMDSGNNRLLKLSARGELLHSFGGAGTASGKFAAANFITLDKHGNVYVADTGNNRIQKFSPRGKPEAEWGSAGTGSGQFLHPTGIAVDGAGNIYASDTYNDRIQKLSPAGAVLATWSAGLSLHHPSGLAFDQKGDIFVADSHNQRVVKLGPGGNLELTWPVDKPDGIAVDRRDRVYVTDRATGQVRVFSSSGKPISTFGGAGTSKGRFMFAARGYLNGIAVNEHGTLYVADTRNNRIQVVSASGKTLSVWK